MDDTTDLSARGPDDPAERAVATAVRAALGQPRPGPDLLGAVQQRATRRHRRRVARRAAVAGLAVAGVAVLVPLGSPQSAPAPPVVPAAPAPSEPAPGPTTTAPAPTTTAPGALTEASVLDLEQVRTVLADAQVLQAPTVLDVEQDLPEPLVAGLCTDQQLSDVPMPADAVVGVWDAEPPSDDVALRPAVSEEVLRWDDEASARAYLAALAAQVPSCTDPASPPPETGTWTVLESPADEDGEHLLGAVADAAGTLQVRAVGAEATTVVSLSAVVPATDLAAAAVAVDGLLDVALERAVRS
ncbi:hypothetical protein [Quadrisphaera sp. DSM 44207]|uniref:hypothetical protein n=1 Tax=Quadrisphaera sp. DSM 44207 TaxID=1881057 RepID=UPI0008801587|nr:hypothetical protein [Quadrisphaera sp. DSM 44207]SDQ86914.1 hypothetical protein SAMN05428996_2962 [Quadrisphaera sp. DSM 44207]